MVVLLLLSYDRFTGRFTLTTLLAKTNNQDNNNASPNTSQSPTPKPVSIKRVLSSKNVFFSPFSSLAFRLNGVDYQTSISWFLLWRSSIYQANTIGKATPTNRLIKELLPHRRRRTILLSSYMVMITSIKLGLMLFVA